MTTARRRTAAVKGGVAAALLLVAAAGVAERRHEPPPELRAVMLREPARVGNVRLVNQRGKAVTSDALFTGRWSFLFLGFASCPNVCPATLNQLAAVKRSLARQFPGTPQPQYIFVSVDPRRDTAPRLASYLSAFDPTFIGATGEPDQLAALSDALTAFHRLSTPTAGGDYGVVHSGEIYLLDPAGRVFARFTPPLDTDLIARQLVSMMAYDTATPRRG